MPLYEYECKKCHHRFEKIQKFSDKMVKKCPDCGGPVEQMISAPAVQFKGSGWYVTDYAKKSSSPGSAGSGESGSKDGKDSKDKDKDKEKKESKSDSFKSQGSKSDGSKSEGSKSEASSKESSSGESAAKRSDRRK
jgi:putative FmdB family regulatory protein